MKWIVTIEVDAEDRASAIAAAEHAEPTFVEPAEPENDDEQG